MEKVRLWCGEPSDRGGRLKNRTFPGYACTNQIVSSRFVSGQLVGVAGTRVVVFTVAV